MYKLSIITAAYNKYNFTKSCLKDLFQLPNHQIIIIDNASTDETQTELSKIKQDNFIYIRNEDNLFHSKACNQGYAVASSDKVLFINNDIRVKSNYSNWTDIIIESCKEPGLYGPTMGLLDKDLNFVKEANQQLIGNSYISGWCIAGNKSTWNKLGKQVWDERYPMYFNDTSLSMRAKKLNIPLKAIPLPDVFHFGKVSSRELNVNKLYNEGRKVFLKDFK